MNTALPCPSEAPCLCPSPVVSECVSDCLDIYVLLAMSFESLEVSFVQPVCHLSSISNFEARWVSLFILQWGTRGYAPGHILSIR